MTASAAYWPRPQSPLAGLAHSYLARRAFKLVSYCALACLLGVLALVATATAPLLFGYHTYTVDGGSMEPALKRGSVAIAAATSPRALRVGDIIAYHQLPQNPPVLHRIVQITNDNGQLGFITQGDQNQTPDTQPVSLQGPGDKVMYTVPYAGYILDFAGSTLGRILLIGLPLLTMLAMFLTPGKRTAESTNESSPARESNVPPAVSTPAWITERPSLETQAFQRGLFSATRRLVGQGRASQPSLEAQALQRALSSPTMQPVGLTRAPQPSLEAQALQRGLFTPTMRLVGQGRASQPSLEDQALQRGLFTPTMQPVGLTIASQPSLEAQAFRRGLLRAVPPAPVEAGPAPRSKAA